MSTKAKAANGGDQSSNGQTEEIETTTTESETDTAKGAVKDAEAVLEKNRQLLANNKKLKDERDAFAKQIKEQEEARLTSNEEYKKLAELKTQEADAERDKRSKLEKALADGRKLRKFLEAVPGKIEPQYYGLIDLEKIVANPDTGEPEDESVKSIARDFEKTYSAVIQRKNSGTLPNDASKGTKASTFKEEISKAKTQKEFDAVMLKYGKI